MSLYDITSVICFVSVLLTRAEIMIVDLLETVGGL